MKQLWFTLFSFFTLISCDTQNNQVALYHSIDLSTAPDSPSLLSKGLISTPLYERDLAIHPDGSEIIYTLGDFKQKRRALVCLQKNGELWQAPEILSISGQYQDIEPFYASGGNRLYFASNRPIFGDSSRTDYNIWFSNRVDEKWSEPHPLDSIINTKGDEFFPVVSEKGNLFFTATRQDGVGREDLFQSVFSKGTYSKPVPLSEAINTAYYEFNAYISPDESLIVFSSYGRSDGLGGGDLYISTKDEHGNWKEATNMGATINSSSLDYCPFIDWENRVFYFTSERSSKPEGQIKTIQEMMDIANSPENGFGNIYHVSLDLLIQN